MKKLLLLTILISFNSFGGWFDKTICVETDSQDRDGVIYLTNTTEPFSGNNLCEYQNGQFKSKGKVEDGKRNGIWTEWKKNGQITGEYNFIEGKEVGEGGSIITRYSNGLKKEEGYYIDDKKDGKWTEWDENGQISLEGSYTEGKENGNWTYWSKSGQIKKEHNFIDGKWIEWNENGQISLEGNYTEGNLASETKYSYYKNGQKKEEVNWKGDKKEGKLTSWFENGQKRQERNYNHDKTDGKFFKWDENGQIRLEGNYTEGNLASETQYSYYENGQKKEVKSSKDDGKRWPYVYQLINDGKFTRWYKNGQKKLEINFINGKRNGKYTSWFKNGQKELESNWKDGKEDGKWTHWYDDGSKSERNYKDGVLL